VHSNSLPTNFDLLSLIAEMNSQKFELLKLIKVKNDFLIELEKLATNKLNELALVETSATKLKLDRTLKSVQNCDIERSNPFVAKNISNRERLETCIKKIKENKAKLNELAKNLEKTNQPIDSNETTREIEKLELNSEMIDIIFEKENDARTHLVDELCLKYAASSNSLSNDANGGDDQLSMNGVYKDILAKFLLANSKYKIGILGDSG
jgi:hypothetical protein